MGIPKEWAESSRFEVIRTLLNESGNIVRESGIQFLTTWCYT